MDSPNNKTKLKYFLAAIGIGSFIGFGYYVYTRYLSHSSASSQDTEALIEEIKGELADGLTVDLAVRIMALINKVVTERCRIDCAEVDLHRRDRNNTQDNFNILAVESLNKKAAIFSDVMHTIISELGLDFELVQNVIKNFDQIKLDKIACEMNPPLKSDIPSKEKVKKDFLAYVELYADTMKGIFGKASLNMTPEKVEELQGEAAIAKVRIEDTLFDTTGLEENDLKYYLFHHGLESDKEVDKAYKQLLETEEMFS